MSNWNPNKSHDDRREDTPPFSRVFIVCSKQLREEDLRGHFESFGNLEDLYIPRDRNTGESKGVAYIKYSKTSSAAKAIQEMNGKVIAEGNKPIKVMVATNKNDMHSSNEERYKRLFIKIHKQATEEEIRKYFSQFGSLDSVHLQRDRTTNECKGFAYVNYNSFIDTAKAFEECDRKYRPVFATPRDELKRSRNSLDSCVENLYMSNNSISKEYPLIHNSYQIKDDLKGNEINTLLKIKPQGYKIINVTCSPQVDQKHIKRLFNIVPGMLQCQYTVDTYNGFCRAIITYEDEIAAAYAVDRLNNYEFPSGEIISVKPDSNPLSKAANDLANVMANFKNALDTGNPDLKQLAGAIAQASTLIKEATSTKMELKSEQQDKNFCNVVLPARQPLANSSSRVALRCFIVCKPRPPPIGALQDAFCRFGDLIDVSTFPNKTFGFAKYASTRAAQDAIRTLDGAILCGIKLKVLEADEKPNKDDQRMHDDVEMHEIHTDHNTKRIKLDSRDIDTESN